MGVVVEQVGDQAKQLGRGRPVQQDVVLEHPQGQAGAAAGQAGRVGPIGGVRADAGQPDDRIGRAARWFPRGNSFSARPSSEPRGPAFQARGSPVTYAAFMTGWAWMTSWQEAQTTRVLRRLVAMSAVHAG